MNMSKLVFDDIALFEGLLKDIFPRQTSVDKVNHAQVEPRIPTIMKKRPELINRPEFTLKIIQVYETSEVRHGFMLLGLSASGKSTIISVLTDPQPTHNRPIATQRHCLFSCFLCIVGFVCINSLLFLFAIFLYCLSRQFYIQRYFLHLHGFC